VSWAVWITGPPGSIAPEVARAAAEALEAGGVRVALLQLDEIRPLLTPSPTDSATEGDLVHRALVYIASTLVAAAVPVVIAAPGHRRAWRDLARAAIPRFAEVQVRDPNAAADAAYEAATSPELTVDTSQETPAEGGERIAAAIADWRQGRAQACAARWALWITGLPGSGKTTIASRVAEALAAGGLDVRVLDLADIRAFIDQAWSPLAEDVAHRALVYAAMRLTEAGVAVIIDATAPARAWRSLARERIARFAEVQLVCPAEVCASRERAVRWRLLGCAHRDVPRRVPDRPDIVLAYERADSPEAVIYTDVEDPWSAADTVLRLAARLTGSANTRVS
jgi:adenylylsulfate kinase